MMTPKRVHSTTNPPREKLVELFVFMQKKCGENPGSLAVSVLLPLMSVAPHRRLSANLHVMLDRMAVTQIKNVLDDGLTDEEKAALLELELRGASDEMLGVAHGLLNVHERWFMLKSVGSKFRAAVECTADLLRSEDLLKDLLEDEDEGVHQFPGDQER